MIKSKDDLPISIYIQWKDDEDNILDGEDQTWCQDKIYKNDIRYILDKRHLTCHSSERAEVCTCKGIRYYTDGICGLCGKSVPPPAA